MSWLAGSVAVTAVTWMLLAVPTAPVLSTPVPKPHSLNAAELAHDAELDFADHTASSPVRFADEVEEEKRRWGRNNLAVWGKRSFPDLSDDDMDLIKRRWGQRNMALWGKRSYAADDDDQWPQPLSKRRWGQKHMAIWGKRSRDASLELDADRLEAATQKRKWGQKNMALWG